ncbi:glycerol kinase [Erythrobacteraceae bacterium CFH 75059]|uniref:FGGY family carbohydrate kinase n=1 Tax=Qipengyuania thermophila TaxID=2509361 RepID=UPI00101FEB99|nr:glycerol kinase [Qipengyuania thermophila]TCD04142.1 glycerol kinase [Erythrobacteraceae bacterium CFH 75059]
MGEQAILVLDEGTTSTRALLYDPAGRRLGMAQEPIAQSYPAAGWVEQDAEEIWQKSLACVYRMVARAGGAERIAAIGITNQRETVVAWDRRTGAALAPAIVWQDRRTAAMCHALRESGREAELHARTGLVLDPYFSATKMRWLLDHVPEVADAAAGERLALGTIDSWLLFRLSGGAFVTDASNASRTQLLALDGAQFDTGLCDVFGVPPAALAEVTDTSGPLAQCDPALFGRALPICGMAGDQQAATIGQGCLATGEAKATFGTGAFILSNTGARAPSSRNRLLGTVLLQQGGQRTYALEGSVFSAGSLVQWLRDALGLLASAQETEPLAASVPDNGGVTIVPALSGLGAPHWRPDARALICGLSFGTTRAHIARAALEAMAHQTQDLGAAFAADGAGWRELRVDGGMSANGWMVQDLADLTGLEVERPEDVETTARGAAMLAACGAGLYADLPSAVSAMRSPAERFTPRLDEARRAQRVAQWQAALSMALSVPLAAGAGGQEAPLS